MIFLIDDNKYGQMSANYKLDFILELKSFPGHVKWLQTVLANEIDMIISEASCILIHDSLVPKEDKDRLVALTKKDNIPYCVFSNGFTATIFEGESIVEIKKDRLYNNLLVFIDHFIAEGNVDLKLLSLGQNYEPEKALIIQDRVINGTLLKHKDNFNYEAAFPSKSEAYKDLMELVYLSEFSIDFSTFEETYISKETTAQVMRGLIINMVKKVKLKYE